MRVAILCQEEPVFLGPFLRQVIRLHPERVAAVFIAGRRGAGERRATLRQRLEALRIFWYLLEPPGFCAALFLRLRARLLGRFDPRSVEGEARRRRIPVYRISDPNGAEFHHLLRQLAPEVVLNQSELLLGQEVLAIPALGFLNRHASLLPRFRGRLASFWSHAAEPPCYGVTIHRVDAGIDTGPIVLQREFHDIRPEWSYPKVMRRLCERAPALFWEAADLLRQEGFAPRSQAPAGKAFAFPTLEQVRHYRRTLSRRRSTGSAAR